MSSEDQQLIAACRFCLEKDDVIVESIRTVHERNPDGSPHHWTLDCPVCGAEVGFGIALSEGELDLS